MSDLERQDALQPDLPAEERSPQEIEREIERTRERMSNNIDALGDKLSPDNLKQQAKDAIAGKARDVAASVGDQARQTGSRALDFITENPLPMAAVTLGAIWLFTMRKGSQGAVSGDRMARFAYTGPERREPNGPARLGRRLIDRAESVRQTVGEKAHSASQRAGELTQRARHARGGLERTMQENPLALVAGAAVIGLALGMLLPETEPERRTMGPARDQLADRVSDVAGRVKDAAVEAGREVKDQIKESAGRVADEAKQEARKPSKGRTG